MKSGAEEEKPELEESRPALQLPLLGIPLLPQVRLLLQIPPPWQVHLPVMPPAREAPGPEVEWLQEER